MCVCACVCVCVRTCVSVCTDVGIFKASVETVTEYDMIVVAGSTELPPPPHQYTVLHQFSDLNKIEIVRSSDFPQTKVTRSAVKEASDAGSCCKRAGT